MKTRLLSIFVVVAIAAGAISCKDDKLKTVEAEKQVDNSFTVTLNLTVPKDDNFQIYYNQDGSDVYPPDSYVDVAVKGSEAAQDIVFKLPEEAFPTSLRFDLGSNKEQGSVKINEFKMKYLDNSFVAKDTMFIHYFGNNQQVDYDRAKAIAKPKVLPNEIYDPIFTGTEVLKEELKKLAK